MNADSSFNAGLPKSKAKHILSNINKEEKDGKKKELIAKGVLDSKMKKDYEWDSLVGKLANVYKLFASPYSIVSNFWSMSSFHFPSHNAIIFAI